MSTALDRIIAYKVDEVAAAKRETPLAALEARLPDASAPRGFAQSMALIAGINENALICELKRKSPSAGDILPGADRPSPPKRSKIWCSVAEWHRVATYLW